MALAINHMMARARSALLLMQLQHLSEQLLYLSNGIKIQCVMIDQSSKDVNVYAHCIYSV